MKQGIYTKQIHYGSRKACWNPNGLLLCLTNTIYTLLFLDCISVAKKVSKKQPGHILYESKETSKSPKLINSSTKTRLQEQNGSVYQAIQLVKEPW